MATICYGLSGEGRGHATRVAAVVEALRADHRLVLFAARDAFDVLAPRYAGTEVSVRPLPAPRFHYDRGGRQRYLQTGLGFMPYLAGLPRLLARLTAELRAERADLVITDFEPALPRAARRLRVPLLSIDHQQFLVVSDLRSLPARLRAHAAWMGAIVGAYHPRPVHRVVSSFFFPPLRRGVRGVTQVGVMLRPEVRRARPTCGAHVVAYWRREAPPGMLEALASIGREVRVYGLGAREPAGNLRFHAVDERRFLDDLASCAALFSTAGNQLVGEAFFLGKPVFAVPEPGNFEQAINAHFLAQSGGGVSVAAGDVSAARVHAFLGDLPRYGLSIPRERLDGLPATLEAIRSVLAPRPAVARRPVRVPA